MVGDDNNKNDGGSGGITYDSPNYLPLSDYPKQIDENKTSHESAAFKTFQRRNVNSEGTKPVANMAHKEDEEFEWIFYSGYTEYITYLSDILVNKKATYFEAPVVIPNASSSSSKLSFVALTISIVAGHSVGISKPKSMSKFVSSTNSFVAFKVNSEGTKPVANMAHKEDKECEWIFDSGYTEYITYLSDILVNKKATNFEAPVVIPNGFQRKNLIGAGRCERGLYQMKMVQGIRAMAITVETWHKRFEHASKGKVVFCGSVYSSATEDINEAKKETLRPDLIGTLDDEYKNDDIVVFKKGYWWTHDKTAKGKIVIKKAVMSIVNRRLYKLFVKP
nr:protein trichome birefringence-like [Tanacetum cinerariifolium]